MPAVFSRPNAWSIQARLVLLVLSVWLPAMLALALLAHATYLREEGAARGRMQAAAENLNATVEAELDKAVVLARALSASDALHAGDLVRFHGEAGRAVGDKGNWVFLVDREQQLVNTLLPGPRALPRPDPRVFLVDGAPVVRFIATAPVVEKPVLGVFAPEARRPARYNVGVAVDPAVLQRVLAQHRGVGVDGMIASAVDDQFQVIARSRDPARWVGVAATGQIRERLRSAKGGFGQSVTLDGVASLSYVSLPNRYGWTIVTALPMSALEAPAWRLTVQASLASAVLLLFGLGLAFYAARRIARPFAVLRASADALGRNEVPARTGTGVREADAVAFAMHDAGQRLEASGRVLQEKVEEAVREARQAELRLHEAQKHEAIGRLTGGIAHDFNNLLQTISMGLHVVERSTPAGVHTRAVTAALNACSKGAALVRQMLAFGRRQPLQPRAVPLRDFLLRHEELTRRAVGERIRLSADVHPDVRAVHADPTQMELALLNLVFNARDAMPQGGEITLRARPAAPGDLRELAPGAYVCLEVRDDGPGIPPELQAKVFDPYFTTKPVGAGSGLGLPQVLAFARGSGGDVHLASAPGGGTTVTLVLPASGDVDADEGPLADDGAPAAPLHVLMVEDDVLVASVVEPALQAEGHRVTLCATGDEALAWLQGGGACDVVFSDVVMPGAASGLDLAAWCERHRPELPVVVATGYTAQEVDGARTVLRKPYTMRQLREALRAAGAAVAA
ncbi:response regulator [Ramlibacter sp. USB13]|uniref:histidine kinase n=1 Tax=Ramlibacter cellulosilyticus TaxID=2764187 RepID=A0A923SCX2_9BURK|nr:ATP-binding protein [Ramlibacter cellulosilyticus]MBC5785426.1 response regulator [Ramlibacter cellulosilyticus]